MDRLNIPVKSAAVSTGRDGDGERGSFSGFLLRPTKRQSSTQPVRLRARQAEKGEPMYVKNSTEVWFGPQHGVAGATNGGEPTSCKSSIFA